MWVQMLILAQKLASSRRFQSQAHRWSWGLAVPALPSHYVTAHPIPPTPKPQNTTYPTPTQLQTHPHPTRSPPTPPTLPSHFAHQHWTSTLIIPSPIHPLFFFLPLNSIPCHPIISDSPHLQSPSLSFYLLPPSHPLNLPCSLPIPHIPLSSLRSCCRLVAYCE